MTNHRRMSQAYLHLYGCAHYDGHASSIQFFLRLLFQQPSSRETLATLQNSSLL